MPFILQGAHLQGANLERLTLKEAKLEEAQYLSIDELSNIKPLYDAKLDKELLLSLKENILLFLKNLKDNDRIFRQYHLSAK
jgi:uncharacterized protein YjbI with pentapeptide repeats